MMPWYSWSVPGRKPGTSTNVSTGMLKASHVRTKRAAFSAALMSSVPAMASGWLATMPTGRPLDVAEPDDHVGREQRLDLEEVALVEHRGDDRLHVVGLVVGVGDQRVEGRVGLGERQVRLAAPRRRVAEVVLRQELQQVLHVVDGVVLVGGEVVRHARLDVVGVPAAELLERRPSSPVTALMTSGPVMNICEVPSAITMKSVRAGE